MRRFHLANADPASMRGLIDQVKNECGEGAPSAVRPDITFFGGAALCPDSLDVTTHYPYVFSSAGALDDRAVVFTFIGGENFHVTTQALTGWKPLGRPFEVTRNERSLLYELDGEPAYERMEVMAQTDGLTGLANRRERFAEMHFDVSGSHTMSLGVCQVGSDETADSLCSRVDNALYAAKARGKNCVIVG